jgi:hypothetical protein
LSFEIGPLRWMIWYASHASCEPRIAFPYQRVEIWEHRRRQQEGIVFVEKICFVCGFVAQEAHHEVSRVFCPRVRESLSQPGKVLVGSRPRTHERGHQERRFEREHQAEADGLYEAARIVQRAHGIAADVPLLAAKIEEFLIGHGRH